MLYIDGQPKTNNEVLKLLKEAKSSEMKEKVSLIENTLKGSATRKFLLAEKFKYWNKEKKLFKYGNRPINPETKITIGGTTHMLRYAEAAAPKPIGDGKTIMHYEPQRIPFNNGGLSVGVDKKDLLLFILLTKHLGKDYFLEDKPAEAKKKAEKEVALLEAKKIIWEELNGKEDQLRRLYAAIVPGADVDSLSKEEIQVELNRRAEADPDKFIVASNSKDKDIKILIHDAMQGKVIEYEKRTRKWVWGGKVEGAGKQIVAVPQGQDELTWFINWIMRTDNTGVLNELHVLVEGAVTQ